VRRLKESCDVDQILRRFWNGLEEWIDQKDNSNGKMVNPTKSITASKLLCARQIIQRMVLMNQRDFGSAKWLKEREPGVRKNRGQKLAKPIQTLLSSIDAYINTFTPTGKGWKTRNILPSIPYMPDPEKERKVESQNGKRPDQDQLIVELIQFSQLDRDKVPYNH
jgi:hypothetical protein